MAKKPKPKRRRTPESPASRSRKPRSRPYKFGCRRIEFASLQVFSSPPGPY